MKFNTFFPTIIADTNYEKHNDIESSLVTHCTKLKQTVKSGGKGWVSKNTYNTSDGNYEIYDDAEFKQLNEWVFQNIINYCQELAIDCSNLKNSGSWFNIYERYDYQEPHTHPNSIISAIYILSAPANSAKIVFTTPINPMYCLKKKTIHSLQLNKFIVNLYLAVFLYFLVF